MTLDKVAVRVGTAAAIGLGLVVTYWAIAWASFADTEAYWTASRRLWSGQPLYPAALDTASSMFYGAAYRYAPWFAVAFTPLALLPYKAAVVVWAAILAVAFGYVAWRVVQARAWLLGALLLPFLLHALTDGNVQPLLVAGLLYGVERRSGPLWIALAASLKGVPLAFALVYLGRRQWWRFGITLALTAALLAPMLAFDLSHYPMAPGKTLLWGTMLYPLVVGCLALAAVRWPDWRLAGVMAVVAMPRFWFYDLTWLLLALHRQQDAGDRHQRVVGQTVPLRGGERHEGVAAQLAKVAERLHLGADDGVLR